MRRKHRKNPDSNTTLLIVALAAIGAGVYLVMQNKDKDDKEEAAGAAPKIPANALPKGTYQDKQGNLVDSTTGQVIAAAKEVDSLLKQVTGKGLVDNLKDLYNYFTSTNGMFVTNGVSGYTDFGDPEVPAVNVSPYGYPQYGYASYRTVSGRI